MQDLISLVEQAQLKKNLSNFHPGDTIKVWFRLAEAKSSQSASPEARLQPFEGVVIRFRGAGLSRTFTVRKVSFGIGVERTFPLCSPRIEKIEILKSGKVRRARLYYLRGALGRAARVEEKKSLPRGTVSQSADNSNTNPDERIEKNSAEK